jgi:RHS repeat-associated protein
VEYRYDEALRLSQLTDGTNAVRYTYDANSQLSAKQFSNGMNTSYEYNDIGLLSSLTHSDREGILDQYKYQYDLTGNKTGINKYRRGLENDSGQFCYGYDVLWRLSEVAKDGAMLRTYEYDAFGNRSRMMEINKRTTYTYNALNQLMRAESPDVTRDYQYDARGNANRILENGLTKNTFQYGALNRLTEATNAVGQAAHYEYNGLGFRAGERISDAGLNPLKQVDYVLDLTKQYHNVLQRTQDDQTKSYLWDYNVVAETSNEGGQFYLIDELGSPLRFTSAYSAIVDSYAYDEFGNDLTGNQGIAQPFGYTGYRYDRLSQTYFAQAREYDPLIGRFSSTDAAKGSICNPMTLQSYLYCWGNPMSYIDHDGNFTSFEGIEAHKELQALVKMIFGNKSSIEYLISGYPYSATGYGNADILIWTKEGEQMR